MFGRLFQFETLSLHRFENHDCLDHTRIVYGRGFGLAKTLTSRALKSVRAQGARGAKRIWERIWLNDRLGDNFEIERVIFRSYAFLQVFRLLIPFHRLTVALYFVTKYIASYM